LGLDTDNDGFADINDAFPTEPDEWLDSDGDGVGSNADAFDYDIAASIDTDNDGYPDEWNPSMSKEDSSTSLSIDIFPNDSSEWLDSDGDGIGNNADFMPAFSLIQSVSQITLYSILALGSLYVSVGFYFTRNLIVDIQKRLEVKHQQGLNTKRVETIVNDGVFWFKYFIFHKSVFFIRSAERKLSLLSDKYDSKNRFILQVENSLELMEKQGPNLEESNDLLEQSKELLLDTKFEKSHELAKKAEDIAKETTQTYLSVNENIAELKLTIKYFKKKGIKTEELELILGKAEKEVGK